MDGRVIFIGVFLDYVICEQPLVANLEKKSSSAGLEVYCVGIIQEVLEVFSQNVNIWTFYQIGSENK